MQRISADVVSKKKYGCAFYDSELGKFLHELLPYDCNSTDMWIAGGAIRDFIQPKPTISTRRNKSSLPRDIDIFFSSARKQKRLCRKLYKKHRRHKLWDDSRREGPCAATFSLYTDESRKTLIDIQAIKIEYWPSLEQTLENFNFTINQCGFDGKDFVFGDTTLWDLKCQELRLVNPIRRAKSTLYSLTKHKEYGYTISKEEEEKLHEAAHLDKSNYWFS